LKKPQKKPKKQPKHEKRIRLKKQLRLSKNDGLFNYEPWLRHQKSGLLGWLQRMLK
jgi:hypothetical protein